MRIELDFSKSIEQNAESFFEKSKKAKKKLAGIETAKAQVGSQLSAARDKTMESSKKHLVIQRRKKDWFEKFHWSFSSDGFLMIGGRDAKSNEQIVKKFLTEKDLFFHADVFGAPHCALKAGETDFSDESKKEAAVFAAVFSRAWESGAGKADVYSALPDQVSKAAPSGESIGKGAFMVYGKREWFRQVPMQIGVGLNKTDAGWRVESGAISSISKRCVVWAKVVPGDAEKSKLAKQLAGFFSKATGVDFSVSLLDELMAMIPNGKSRMILEK